MRRLFAKLLPKSSASSHSASLPPVLENVTPSIIHPPVDRDSIYYKSLMISGLEGWYLEFGVYRGHTFQLVYWIVHQIIQDFVGDTWDAGLQRDKEAGRDEQQNKYLSLWNDIRFVAFDSFQGIPEDQTSVDRFYPAFPAGSYACGEEEFLGNMDRCILDRNKIITVPGFFDETLTAQTAARIGLTKISVAHIDSDLYSSAKLALDFCTPFFRDGSIVIFDEWFQFRGNPFLGERRAFTEWQAQNPDWFVSEFATQGPWSKAFILSRKPDFEAADTAP